MAQAFPESNVCKSEFPYLGVGTRYRLDSTVEVDPGKRVSHNYSYDTDGNPVRYQINANYAINFPATATIEFRNRVAKWTIPAFGSSPAYEKHYFLNPSNLVDSVSKTDAVGSAKHTKLLEMRYAPDYFVQLQFSDSGKVTGRDSTWYTDDKAEVFQLIGTSMINTHHCMSAHDTCYCANAQPGFINLWLTYENGRSLHTHFIDKPYDERNYWRDLEPTGIPRRAPIPNRAVAGRAWRPDGRHIEGAQGMPAFLTDR